MRIFGKDIAVRTIFFVVGEGILIYLAILVAAFLTLDTPLSQFLTLEVLGKALLFMGICQIFLYFNDLYDIKVSDSYLETSLRLTNALGITSVTLAIVYYLLPSLIIARGTFFVSLGFVVILVVPWRYTYSWILKKRMFSENILILGQGGLSRQLVEEINSRLDSGYAITALVSPEELQRSSAVPNDVNSSPNGTIEALARRTHTKKVVVAVDQRRGNLPINDLLRCKVNGIEVIEGETLYEELTGKLYLEKLNPSWLVFSDGFKKPVMSRFAKRVSGLFLAAIGLVFVFPMFCVVAVGIKIDSRGPVFFKQKRVGMDGKPYDVIKFRSMVEHAEAKSGPVWATDNDTRITRVGRVLRKYRLDELPQLWNVLVGEMNFVGPRPERPEFVKMLVEKIPYYSERHTVKPGITGWAQVCYRYGASIDETMEKLKYDLFYVKNMSLAFDLLIMFKTIKIMVLQTGAR